MDGRSWGEDKMSTESYLWCLAKVVGQCDGCRDHAAGFAAGESDGANSE